MADYNYLKIYSFGRLTMSERIQPVDKTSPTILNLLKTPEYVASVNLIDAIDHFICDGLEKNPTLAHLDKLIALAYQRYSYAIALKLNLHSENQFKEFCQKRYYNEEQKVKIAGIIFKLKRIGINLLGDNLF